MRAFVRLFWLALGLFAASSARAASVQIDVDTSMADRLLQLTCSDALIDAAEFARSPLLAAQFQHHSRFGAAYTIDNYVKGVEAIARCQTPDPDPFRFASLVKQREVMRGAITFLSTHRQDLGSKASALILPYVPADFKFRGSVVLAPATFSCGGFAQAGHFFIDIPCIAENISGEYDAVVRLTAHETYHAIQDRMMPKPRASFGSVTTVDDAAELLFYNLAAEGSASFVGDMLKVEGDGHYAKFSRAEAENGFRRLEYTAKLFDYSVELLRYDQGHVSQRLDDFRDLIFAGSLGQSGYFLGQQMSAQIAQVFGPAALPCVLSLPAENFILAYDRALATGKKDDRSPMLGQTTLTAARRLAASRSKSAGLNRCLARPS